MPGTSGARHAFVTGPVTYGLAAQAPSPGGPRANRSGPAGYDEDVAPSSFRSPGPSTGIRVSRAVAAAMLAGALACGQIDDASYDEALRSLQARIEGAAANQALAERVQVELARAQADPDDAVHRLRARLDELDLVPLRVPGLWYRTHPWTGADLSRAERWLGRPVALVETGEVASVEENAAVVSRDVRRATGDGRRALVFSASKGSADVQEALRRDPALAPHVAVWVDLVGLLEGTPLTESALGGAALAASGLPGPTAQSMSRAVRSASPPLSLPSETRAVHVAGFPTRADISERARAGFELLRPLGPNDGFVLLESLLRAPGRVLVVPGADHYLRAADLEARLVALLAVLLHEPE